MIAQLRGRLVAKDLDRIEVMTDGGVGYELAIPLGVFETLPSVGEPLSLHTHLVVRDDGWLLFGFTTTFEKRLFQRLLSANGIGPSLALGMLSALSAERLARAIRERDIATLQGVPRVGRKKAERLVLDLADKLDDVHPDDIGASPRRPQAGSEDAIRALVSLGYSAGDAERAVRAALEEGGRGTGATELIRLALTKVVSRS